MTDSTPAHARPAAVAIGMTAAPPPILQTRFLGLPMRLRLFLPTGKGSRGSHVIPLRTSAKLAREFRFVSRAARSETLNKAVRLFPITPRTSCMGTGPKTSLERSSGAHRFYKEFGVCFCRFKNK